MTDKNTVKLVHYRIETPLILSPLHPQLLIAENPDFFYRAVTDLKLQSEGQEGEFVWQTYDNRPLNARTTDVVTDWFNINANDKKNVTALHKKLQQEMQDCQYTSAFNEINAKLTELLEELLVQIPFAIGYEEMQPTALFKAMDVKVAENYDCFTEKLLNHIDILRELCGIKVFVLVNVKSVLDDKGLQSLYDHCANEQICLLLLEHCKCRPLLDCEQAVIITEDLCEILENHREIC